MTYWNRQVGLTSKVNVEVSGAGFTEILPPASGYIYEIVSVFATNNDGVAQTIQLHCDTSGLIHPIPVSSSGTLVLDTYMDGQERLVRSSGLYGQVGSDGGPFNVTVGYVTHDDREPLSKDAYRAQTWSNSSVTRTPSLGH